MGKPVGWQYESGRHALAARGIRTTRARAVVAESMSHNQVIDYFHNFKTQLYYHEGGLGNGVKNGDIGSMQEFIALADEAIDVSENLGLGREKFIKNIRKARNNVERALTDEKFMYKYLKIKENPRFSMWDFDSKPHSSMAGNDMDMILYDLASYSKFKNEIKNMELRSRIY